MKHLHLTLLALLLSFASFAVAPITGVFTVCVGSTTPLSDATTGGTWSSSNPAIASVSATGVVSGNGSGTAIITYTDGISPATVTITVNPVPPPITGTMAFCLGTTTTLGDGVGGGIWTSGTTTVATISSGTGIATGLTLGTATITYTLATGCYSTAVVTVLAIPAVITGPSTVCEGSSVTLGNSAIGGTWYTTNPAVGTVDPVTGVLTGVTAGNADVHYVLSTGCSVGRIVTVLATPAAITGITSVCTGTTVTLASTTAGATWSSSSAGVASVDPVTGDVTGVSPGLAIINYTNALSCTASIVVTVSSTPPAGPISGPSIVCTTNSISLSGVTTGGTWVSSDPSVGTIDMTTGVFTGIAAGTAIVSYTLSGSCGADLATSVITVATIVAPGTISGATAVCSGSNSFLSSTVAGGTWSSSNLAIGTVSAIGQVFGISAGNVNITYTITLACGTSSVVTPVTVNPLGVITVLGPSSICVGGTTTLNPSPAFGTWSTGSSLLTVSSTGVVTGVAAGIGAISYTTTAGCMSTIQITVNPAATAGTLSGPTAVCPGGNITIASTVTGGTWTMTNGNATIGALTGIVTGVSAGVDTAVYTVITPCGTMTAMWGVTVSATPSAGSITGTGTVCVGLTTTLSDIVTGGTWASGSPLVATIGASSGVVTGIAAGTSVITYTVTMSCGTVSTNTVVTVTPTGGTITGTAAVCIGGTSTLSSSVSGGTWVSSAAAVATINPTTGFVTGISAGTSSITYTLPGGCSTSRIVTVNAPAAIAATATAAACGGLYNVVATGAVSYIWSPAAGVTCSTCGTTTIEPSIYTTYTVSGVDTNGCSGAGTATISVNRVYGHIYYTGATPTVLDTKVWLVHYNPSDSSIVDSANMITCLDGGIPYYEFDGVAAGNYLIKAKLLSSVTGTSDYIPTYGTSEPSWFSATGLTHAATSDVQNVTMIYGTVPPGPGFISGYVYTGAGKGTAGLAPAIGMLVYLRDAFSWEVKGYTYTDAAGLYSFSSLGTGSYIIYPEDYKYYTTPSAIMTIGSPYNSYTAVNFRQRTTSHTIKPYSATEIPVAAATGTSFSVYPNPTTGILNIEWNAQVTGLADVTVTDVLGRRVMTSVVDVNTNTGKTQTDLSSLAKGVYYIKIKGGSIDYSSKVVIE